MQGELRVCRCKSLEHGAQQSVDTRLRSEAAAARQRDNLQEQLDGMQAENEELKQLLTDYGLVWLGGSRATRSDTHSSKASHSPDATERAAETAAARELLPQRVTAKHGTSDEHDSGHAAADDDEQSQSERAVKPFRQQEAVPAQRAPNGCDAGGTTLTHVSAAAGELLSDFERGAEWVAQCAQQLRQSVADLNREAASAASHAPWRAGTRSDEVLLVVWKDGLQLHRQKLAAWRRSECTSMLRDILEGC